MCILTYCELWRTASDSMEALRLDMSGSALTAPCSVKQAKQCVHCCRRERSQRLQASISRPFTEARPRKRAAHHRTRAAEPATIDQSAGPDAEESRKREADRAQLNQLARMMPDPAEDELFDDGKRSSTAWNRRVDEKELFQRQGLYSDLLFDNGNEQQGYNEQDIDQYPYMDMNGGNYGYADDFEEDISEEELKEVELGLAQIECHLSARRRWEVEQAEQRALELHHEQVGRGVNRFCQSIGISTIMEVMEKADRLAGDNDAPPSWIRAHFRLEENWDGFAAAVQAVEEEDRDMDGAKSIQDAAMDMLDEENYVDEDFEMESVSRPSSDASQLRSSGGDESDSSLDPLLACMPGTEFQEEEEVQKFLQGPDDDEGDDDVDE